MESEDGSDYSGLESGLLADVKKAPLPNWDIFRETPPSTDTGSAVKNKVYLQLERLAKVLAYLVTFLVVAAASIVSKGSTLFIIKQVGQGTDLPFCGRVDGDYKVDINCSSTYTAGLKTACQDEREIEKVAWIWGLAIAFTVPQLGSFVRSLRKCLFKFNEWAPLQNILFVIFMESCHSVGLALLVFLVLPALDSVRALLLTSSLAIVPAAMLCLSRLKENNEQKISCSPIRFCVDVLALVAQLSGACAWLVLPLLPGLENHHQLDHVWALPTALVLTSFGWWETFTHSDSWTSLGQWLYEVKAEMALGLKVQKEESSHFIRSNVTRNTTYVVVAPIKITIFFICMALLPWYAGTISHPSELIDHFQASFGEHSFTVSSVIIEDIPGMDGFSAGFSNLTLIHMGDEVPHATYLILIQVFSSYLAYVAAKFASKVQIQLFSFALPISLALPCCFALLLTGCGAQASDPCVFSAALPDRLFFQCPQLGDFFGYLWSGDIWLGLVWLLSYLWITLHIWYPKSPRLATSEQIFGTPWYDGLFIDQSLMMNRRRDGTRRVKMDEDEEDEEDLSRDYLKAPGLDTGSSGRKTSVKASDTTTRIYACATMWHETEEEIMEMLKSIFRVDSDYSKRRLAQKYFGVVDPDYYEWESHILFDDSHKVVENTTEGKQRMVNDYVVLLCSLIDKAGSRHFKKAFRNKPCKKYPTPYGGRLVWTLPGKTKIVCHLKDKKLIRNKKRWSQIMYMYYLLGFKIMELPISDERKEARAENTFLLALDGDVDFQPEAVIRLVDLMKKNKGVGAACGRIHPTGAGYMPAYQVFEYAVGHWLQKATEHVLGCVLCSPGCFSLFRGQALMDDNVMKKYTKVPVKPNDHIQYDQGEDRWLCTLMLQQGWRVEYSAASDSYTACPDGFDEFYKQRKRWMPSTLLNILDLLSDWKSITQKNEDISKIYILYQMGIMVGTFVGPGAIYMVLASALGIVTGLDITLSIILNAVPIFFFCLACYYTTGKFQLALAKLLTLGYTMVMLAVYVGVVVEVSTRGFLSAPAISAYTFFVPLMLAGIMHPEEAYCMLYMPIYLITIPSMYVLLVIYSLFNLNDISWGTREAAKTKEEMERDKLDQMEIEEWSAKNKTGGLLGTITAGLKFGELGGGQAGPAETGSVDFSIGNVLRCMCFTKEDPQESKLNEINLALRNVSNKLTAMEKGGGMGGPVLSGRRRSSIGGRIRNMEGRMGSLKEDESETSEKGVSGHEEEDVFDEEGVEEEKEVHPTRDHLENPFWLEDDRLGKGSVDFLKIAEINFWKNLITKYLEPFNPSPVETAKQKKELSDYRDSFIFSFVMINVLYIVLVIMLQFQAGLKLEWNLFESFYVAGQDGLKYAFSYSAAEGSGDAVDLVIVRTAVDELDVIGLFFMAFFSSIVLAQMVGMFFHRWQTLCQYIASTKLKFVKDGNDNSLDEVMKVAHEVVEAMQAPEAEQKKSGQAVTERRKTISALTSIQRKTGGGGEEINLERQFLVKFNLPDTLDTMDPMMRRLSTRRGTMAVLANRRASFINNERRRSSVGFTSLPTRESSFSSGEYGGRHNQGYEDDSMFGEEEEAYSDWTNDRPMGRNSVQFDVSTSDQNHGVTRV